MGQGSNKKAILAQRRRGAEKDKIEFLGVCSEGSSGAAPHLEDNLRLIPTGTDFAMIPGELEKSIDADEKDGHLPCCVVATLGTTSSTGIDPLRPGK